MKKYFLSAIILLLVLLSISSCDRFTSSNTDTIVATVHDINLYEKDVARFNFPEGLTEKDSISVLMQLIDSWATKQLLMHEAKKNMSQKQQNAYQKLVEDYELNLFTDAFKNGYVTKNLNTVIAPNEVQKYYNQYKNNFASKQTLVKARFIEYPDSYKNSSATKKSFNRFNEEDQEELSNSKASFRKVYLNENDEWISYDSLQVLIPSISKFEENKILSKNKLLQYKNGNSEFFVKFTDILNVGSPSPLPYVEESIKQIILNKRKLALKKQLEIEILEDAKKNENYQIY